MNKLIQSEVQHRLGYSPRVEAHVVLCGSSSPELLSTSERRFVHTLDEFLKISDVSQYKKIVEHASQGYLDLFEKFGKSRPNSHDNKVIFQQFFAGRRVRPKEFSHFNFVAERQPWFKHRLGLFNEYKGHHHEVVNDKALMRRWDFTALGVGNATQQQWSVIALRESRVFSRAKDHERGLEEYLLRPLVPLSESDITEDLTELYELKRTFSRLDEYLLKEGKGLNSSDRLDIARALIVPFAELHGLGIAHRDIDLHNLWHASDQKSIVISGFASSFFPERGTVKDFRHLVQGSHIRLPEDELRVDGDILDPFRQDVFMLGVAACRVMFPDFASPQCEEGFWQWNEQSEDPYDGLLDHWLKTAMALDPADRYANATEMLAALNEAIRPPAQSEEEAASTWQSIANGTFIKRGWGPFDVFQNFRPDPGEVPGSGQVMKYKCTVNGTPAYLKFWQKVAPNATTHGLNRRVSAFRARADQVANGGLSSPALESFGLLESGGLFVVTRMEPGQAWSGGSFDKDIVYRRALAYSLVKAVITLHDQQVGHGDIHPENLLISNQTSFVDNNAVPTVLLLDLLDFGEESQPFNVEYGPANPAAVDAFARDRFAVYKIVSELLSDEDDKGFTKELETGRAQQLGVPVSLVPLHDEISRLLKGAVEESRQEASAIVVVTPRIVQALSEFTLEQDAGVYHFNCRWDKRDTKILNCYVTGLNGAITFAIDPEQRQLRDVRLTAPIALSELVSSSSKATSSIQRPITLLQGARGGGTDNEILDLLLSLDPVLNLLSAKFSPAAGQDDVSSVASNHAPTEAIWRALLGTEQESLLEVEVTGSAEENPSGQLVVPYRSSDGRAIDFESDDRVLVSLESDENSFATLDIFGTTPEDLMLDISRNDAKKRLKPGATLRLESIMSKASRDRKAKAMERVLDGASSIPNLAQYFSVTEVAASQKLAERPTREKIRSLYDSETQRLNERQVHAFMELVERGPVGVLQGPPGTGKTTFVGAFIHYLFSELKVRNVLLVGQSHTAVDAVARKARAMCASHEMPLSVVRMGQERMIATEMLDTHSRAIQRQMRHAFHREYEHRIETFSEKLGLPERLISEVAALHRTLEGIFSSVERYEADLSKAKSDSEDGKFGARLEFFQDQLDEVRSLRDRIIYQRFPDEGMSLLEAQDPWGAILEQVAKSHNVNNPSAVSRLRSLLALSKDWLSVLQAGQSNYDQFLVQTRQLVCGTLVGMGMKSLGVAETEFDWVIVDEAARAQASELMIPLQSGRRILLIGDHRQLPPVYERSHIRAAAKQLRVLEDTVKQTDFERAFRATRGVTLDTQYRMVEPIGQLVSECFYKEDGVSLNTGRDDAPNWYSDLVYPLNKPVAWIDSGAGPEAIGEEERVPGRYTNAHEAKLVMRVLQRLTSSEAIQNLRRDAHGSTHPIGVITMYRAQKNLLEKELSKAEWAASIRSLIRIDTVDSYQGQENPIIILSLVRDNLQERQGFMWDPSRINVSLSRAQERLIVVGAARMWKLRNRDDPLGKVLRFIEERCAEGDGRYVISQGLAEHAYAMEQDGVKQDA